MELLSFVEYYVVCVFFKWNNQPPKKRKKNCSLVSLKWDFHIEISNETGAREMGENGILPSYRHWQSRFYVKNM